MYIYIKNNIITLKSESDENNKEIFGNAILVDDNLSELEQEKFAFNEYKRLLINE